MNLLYLLCLLIHLSGQFNCVPEGVAEVHESAKCPDFLIFLKKFLKDISSRNLHPHKPSEVWPQDIWSWACPLVSIIKEWLALVLVVSVRMEVRGGCSPLL